jgi:hypothetical protein
MEESMNEANSKQWRKSSYSGANGGDCVEVTQGAIRDSKNPETEMPISPRAFYSLITGLK